MLLLEREVLQIMTTHVKTAYSQHLIHIIYNHNWNYWHLKNLTENAHSVLVCFVTK